ncbi:AAA family ATPase [Candidatus Venteria ishoeyi]|uniref:ORC1/DEAH AAA+ ATPase domain-containing protein n=1 Tax=Candidatus Venteria ishoeyi TaxID=1899563 RepID=A0A1H6F3E3_9GAMM|nr:AAA family ATPase [Candidatus Venteria ishoeyi]MDM8545426.1 AAA family ATPase [Candidatus Venteria ishoeyi]SEH04640.1 Uncharacterised protein [Candidatus Venteria ishoeyi]
MRKRFNTAGPCRDDIHYLINPLSRLPETQSLIDSQQYFAIYGPRQSGKTTCLYALMGMLNREATYTALTIDVQVAADCPDEAAAMHRIANAIYHQAKLYLHRPEHPPEPDDPAHSFTTLQDYLSRWAKTNRKPLVLFFDEIDSLGTHLLLPFLRQLRTGFEARPKKFPHSIVLVGLRDIQEYQFTEAHISPSEQEEMLPGVETPFNICSKSLRIKWFNLNQVGLLLEQHSEETGQVFNEDIQYHLYQLTNGQPWLINALANILVELSRVNSADPPLYHEIDLNMVKQAKIELLQHNAIHLENLFKKLKEPKFKLIIEAILTGGIPDFNHFRDALNYAYSFGIVTRHTPITFSTPIYQYAFIISMSEPFQWVLPPALTESMQFVRDGNLDPDQLLTAFQQFYYRHGTQWLSQCPFQQAGCYLLLFAFLLRTLGEQAEFNWHTAMGVGYCSMHVEFVGQTHLFCMKLSRDQYAREEGLIQLREQLKQHQLNRAYLLLFDVSHQNRVYREEIIEDNKHMILFGM